jgi:hypothetical protein
MGIPMFFRSVLEGQQIYLGGSEKMRKAEELGSSGQGDSNRTPNGLDIAKPSR